MSLLAQQLGVKDNVIRTLADELAASRSECEKLRNQQDASTLEARYETALQTRVGSWEVQVGSFQSALEDERREQEKIRQHVTAVEEEKRLLLEEQEALLQRLQRLEKA